MSGVSDDEDLQTEKQTGEKSSSVLDNVVILSEDEVKPNDSNNQRNNKTENGNARDTKDDYSALMKTLSSSSSSVSSVEVSERSSGSSSDDSASKNKWKESRGKLKDKLKEAKDRLEEETSISENLKRQLREETDAKERVESNLAELQEKYRQQLQNEEALQTKFNNKKNYCDNLVKKLTSLGQERPDEEVAENGENSDSVNEDDENKVKETMEDMKKKYDDEADDLKNFNASNQVLINTYLSQIEQLDNENVALKHKISRYEGNSEHVDLTDAEKEKILPLVEKQVQIRLQEMENCSTGQTELRSKNTALESKLKTVKENCDEYMKKYKEAIIALKEIKEAYGDQRDEVVHKYKEENESLKEHLQNHSQAKPNEDIVTILRQDILDARLALERNRKTHQEDLAEDQKKMQVAKQNLKNTVECLEEQSDVNVKLKNELEDKQDILRATEELSNQRMQIINGLKLEVVAHKDNIKVLIDSLSTKDEEIADLRGQITQQTEALAKGHLENEGLERELEVMESLKEDNQNLMDEIDEMKNKVKTKKMKVKFMKKQLEEFEEQKEKFEKIVFMLPEMQKKIDQLEEEKQRLRDELSNQVQKEQDRAAQLEHEKRDREERIQREREDWERRLLGIGECELYHTDIDGIADRESSIALTGSFNRPSSAPLVKPRPPSARRYNTTNGHRRTQTNPPLTLHPSYLNSSQEGRRASEKVRSGQHRIVMNGKNQNKLFRSATQQMNHVNSFSAEDRFFPNLQLKTKKHNRRMNGGVGDQNVSPRVLVWGGTNDDGEDESAGKKLVAVGDRVMARILRDCSFHGRDNLETTGLVKFIGFIKGNEKYVYIGLRMDDEVGNTDGCVEGRRYFCCEPTRGKFVRLVDIVKVLETRTTHHSPVL